jgi:cell division protein FtsQ
VAGGLGGRVSTRIARPPLRIAIATAVGIALMVALWFWLRDSSLVAVTKVEVSGIYGAQAAQVRDALETTGRSMTTLHVRQDALVKRLEVATSFPHTLRIHVVTNVAVAAVLAGGQRIPVTADGTLLRDVPASASASLPTIPLRSVPAGERLTSASALIDVAALGAAPAALRGHVSGVSETSAHGLSVQMSHGPVLWFGDGGRLVAKWAAVTAVLADSQSAGASSIDVSAPERPAVGGLPDGAPATGASDVPTPPPGTDTTTQTTQTTPGG